MSRWLRLRSAHHGGALINVARPSLTHLFRYGGFATRNVHIVV